LLQFKDGHWTLEGSAISGAGKSSVLFSPRSCICGASPFAATLVDQVAL
jgi:hypothetical protein